ncbi:hypothetical protein ACIOJD_19100 [Streptomyces sp. NPDC088116]|uniref:hypothetical protein n=1 Tax=Streptomyces sp. NPDC088116 TaxID=3365825 RepID=UPI00383077BE
MPVAPSGTTITTTTTGTMTLHTTTVPTGTARAVGAMDLALPATFEAFYTLHHDRYLAYARAHMSSTAAAAALREAFGELATHWSHVLRRPNPTAEAWEKLVRRVGRRAPALTAGTTSYVQYQVVVLHHLAGCSVNAVADTTGLEPCRVRYLLRTWSPPGRCGSSRIGADLSKTVPR